MSPVVGFFWLKRISGYALRPARLTGLRSSIVRLLVGDDSASSPLENVAARGKAALPSTQSDVELAAASLSKWLEETTKVKSYVVEANTNVHKQIASIQASIVFAQDNLPENDEDGRQALKKKIDCAEKFHQKACQFNKLADDVMRVAALIPQLVRIIDGLRPADLADVIDPITERVPVDSSRGRSWITRQLTLMECELLRLETCAEGGAVSQVSACVVGLEAVVRLLTRHIDEVCSELAHLVVVIDELDRTLAFSTEAKVWTRQTFI